MSELQDEGMASLAEARTVTMKAAEELWQRRQAAFEAEDFEEYQRCAAAYQEALKAQDRATERLLTGILEPTEDGVESLKAAVARLDARIEAYQEGEALLTDLAAGLGILTHTILLFGML